MSAIRDFVGTSSYSKVGLAVDAAFPDRRSTASDEIVDSMVVRLWETLGDAGCQGIGLRRPSDAEIETFKQGIAGSTAGAPKGQGQFRHYQAKATHTRKFLPKDAFLGQVPMARVTLAATTAAATTIKTDFGDYVPQDHLYASAAQIAWKFSEELGDAPVARVDLVANMRMGGHRFGAVSIYLGYRQGDAAPSFYILEAGFATGESAVSFLSKDMTDVTPSRSYYQPTAFSSDRNYYSARLELTGDDPKKLTIWVQNQPQIPAHLQVEIEFEAGGIAIWPMVLTIEAAARVGLIAQTIGMQTREALFAPIGAILPWIHRPEG
jgi:hypothetical protein